MVETQKNLTIRYRELFGISKLIVSNDTTDTIFADKISNNYSYIIRDCDINNNLIVNSSLYVQNSITCNNVITTNNIFITNTSIFNNLDLTNIYITNNCNIINDAIINGNTIHDKISQLSSLNTNNIITNNININDIYQHYNNNVININSDSISIGNTNSIINILGNLSYISNYNLKISDKLITLKDSSLLPNSYYGFEILGTTDNGFIKTLDNNRYEIKAPLDTIKKYIVEVDLDENINITGTSLLYNNVTVGSNINILKDAVYYNIYSNNLNISSTSVCNNYYSNNINISDLSYISNNLHTNNLISNTINVMNMTVLSGLNIKNNCYILSNVTINSDLLINNNLLVKNNISILSNLQVNNSTIINNNITINSNLYISSSAILNNNVNVSKLNVFNDMLINNSFTLLSKLTVIKNISINGNITLNNSFITGNIIIPLSHYDTNTAAASVPIWGLYRTGGIVKIKLDSVGPEIRLNGPTTISITVSQNYTDPGVITTDNMDSGILTYITSIIKSDNTIVRFTGNMLIGSSSLNTNLRDFIRGIYIVTYTATDSIGNVTTKTRNISSS